MTMMHLLTDLLLTQTADRFFLESPSQQGPDRRVLVIDRVSHDILLADPGSFTDLDGFSSGSRSRRPVRGILGVARLVSGPALIVVTDSRKVGDITRSNHCVHQVTSTQILQFAKSTNHLTSAQQQENSTFISMLESVLSTPNLYFSYTADLSQSMQRKWDQDRNLGDDRAAVDAVGLFTKWDERFVWNRHMLGTFLDLGAEFLRYCLPVIQGAAFVRQCSLGGRLFRWSLISRRSNRRAGTRFFVRGCDDSGDCANFVETEQIVETADGTAAFVQTRGSIPLFWTQTPNVVDYKPDPKLEPSKKHLEAFTKHFEDQCRLYGEQTMVNLIDHKKGEGELEKHIKGVHQTAALPGVAYHSFDFHKECSNLKWDRLHALTTSLNPTQQRYSYFLLLGEGGGVETMRQNGVFRTNCMDCLDRTNVVQSLLSLEFMQDCLSRMGVLTEGQRITAQETFQMIFRNVWADHADLLSVQYAGTGALKTDFTRTGRRTAQGMAADLANSAVRYYKNNFADGFRQDAIDLFLGNYRVEDNPVGYSPYAEHQQTTWLSFVPASIFVTLTMAFLTFILAQDMDDQVTVMFLVFWLACFIAMSVIFYRHASYYVDFPRLKSAIR